ncbi:hypothetical protein EPN18_10230 [bacterium]|nr:MAG: hypothetical protein EPN18_10230 [bacterium]
MKKDKIKEAFAGLVGADITPDNAHRGVSAINAPRELFSQCAGAFKDAGFRLVAEWALDETPLGRGFAVCAAYAHKKEYIVVKSSLPIDDAVFPTLTGKYVAAFRFERQIHSLFGITAFGHPDLRPWIKHEDWPAGAFPLRKNFNASAKMERVKGEYRWIRAEGEGVFEIAVGPVHAGIIEPGHFRFQSVGEDIINLETRFGYVHKGIEKRFEELSFEGGVKLAGRVSGDTTVAHSLAYCRAIETASGSVVPRRAHWLRAVFLELERIANHLGDIGAICNDTAFTFMHYQMAILREKILKTNYKLFGHRLTMDVVTLGGVRVDITDGGVNALLVLLDEMLKEFERLVKIYEDNPSLEDRVYSTGILAPDIAAELGVVGFVGRASGQAGDARIDCPFTPYDEFIVKAPLLRSGDVHARAWVRIEEVRESVRLIRELIGTLPSGLFQAKCLTPLEGVAGFSVVEGWRGEIIYWVQAGRDGVINRCMVRDPSSVNWLSIEQAIKGNIVPDFPLCNKSFNQSYSGHDL